MYCTRLGCDMRVPNLADGPGQLNSSRGEFFRLTTGLAAKRLSKDKLRRNRGKRTTVWLVQGGSKLQNQLLYGGKRESPKVQLGKSGQHFTTRAEKSGVVDTNVGGFQQPVS